MGREGGAFKVSIYSRRLSPLLFVALAGGVGGFVSASFCVYS